MGDLNELFLFDVNTADAGSGSFLLNMLLNAVALFAGAYLLKGVEIKDFLRALIVAVVLALLNATLGKILSFLAFPVIVLTLGIFSWVINAFVILLASRFLEGFTVRSFWWALALAIIIAIFNSLLFGVFT